MKSLYLLQSESWSRPTDNSCNKGLCLSCHIGFITRGLCPAIVIHGMNKSQMHSKDDQFASFHTQKISTMIDVSNFL